MATHPLRTVTAIIVALSLGLFAACNRTSTTPMAPSGASGADATPPMEGPASAPR